MGWLGAVLWLGGIKYYRNAGSGWGTVFTQHSPASTQNGTWGAGGGRRAGKRRGTEGTEYPSGKIEASVQ